MKFRHVSGSPLEIETDLLVIFVFGNPTRDPVFKAADAKLDGLLVGLAKDERFVGKSGQSLAAHTGDKLSARRLLVFGAGDKRKFQASEVRNLAARAIKVAEARGAQRVCFVIPEPARTAAAAAVQFAAEGALLGSYRFDKYRRKPKAKPRQVRELTIVGDTSKSRKGKAAKERAARASARRAQAIADAICAARDYVNEPAEFMTPAQLASTARAMARKHPRLKAKVLSAKQCEQLGMNMYLAVGRGSDQPSNLIHLTYTPKKKAKKRIALIGKGVTFDSGGYSLKPSQAMEDMKTDMAGAATVIAAMGAIAELDCPYEVHAIAACAENLVSGRAYKLGDVLRSMDGTTVEINNTDAEGRLTLGDAICYARAKVKPDEMFDFATLTGACVVALGPHIAGVLTADDRLADKWLAAAAAAGEEMWRLPLSERLREQLKSSIADMRNTGERWGGAITAGLFLKTFAKDTPWLHVDLAGPSSSNSAHGAVARGGTGFGVATILEYLSA